MKINNVVCNEISSKRKYPKFGNSMQKSVSKVPAVIEHYDINKDWKSVQFIFDKFVATVEQSSNNHRASMESKLAKTAEFITSRQNELDKMIEEVLNDNTNILCEQEELIVANDSWDDNYESPCGLPDSRFFVNYDTYSYMCSTNLRAKHW